jgi:hypothetical protein
MKIDGESFTVQDRATAKAREYGARRGVKPRKIEAYRDGYLAGFADATRRGPELFRSLKKELERSVIDAIRSLKSPGDSE